MGRINDDLAKADAATERPWEWGADMYPGSEGLVTVGPETLRDPDGMPVGATVVFVNNGHGSGDASLENHAHIVASANGYPEALRLLDWVRDRLRGGPIARRPDDVARALAAIEAFDTFQVPPGKTIHARSE